MSEHALSVHSLRHVIWPGEGNRISWFSQRDICDACDRAGLRILATRRHSLGVAFGDRFWPSANFQLEARLEKWARRCGADAIYLLGAG